MDEIIKKAIKLNLWNSLDIQFAEMILQKQTNNALMLAITCLSANNRNGHVCLPIYSLQPKYLFNGLYPELANIAWKISGSLSNKNWNTLLLSSNAISDGSIAKPLILENNNLYFHRMWYCEHIVANFFKNNNKYLIENTQSKIINLINQFFPSQEKYNWQKIATTIAITNKITLISGGPGTGKTSIISKLLVILLLIKEKKNLIIKVAAFTGKATRKLNESIMQSKDLSKLDNNQKEKITNNITTLHKLIGTKLYNNEKIYNENNTINLDVLIIDEASMIDLIMMANIILALPRHARIIIIGDHNQLPSIDPGSILSDIYQLFNKKRNINKYNKILQLKNHELLNDKIHHISDNLCILYKNYRFKKNSGIAKLANSINKQNINETLKILTSNKYNDISYIDLNKINNFYQIINQYINNYQKFFQLIDQQDTPQNILKTFNEYRVLCVLQEGPFGVIQINQFIESIIKQKKIIQYNSNNHDSYIGKPILILNNDPLLNLFNGDIGIILQYQENIPKAYFQSTNEQIIKFQLSSLPKYETCFAMTVHKSQGSEFNHVSLILPKKIFPILTKEIFYTAVTRAKYHFSLYATTNLITYTTSKSLRRQGGLTNKLKNLLIN